MEDFDLATPPHVLIQHAIAAAVDRAFFDRSPASSRISRSLKDVFLLWDTEIAADALLKVGLAIDLANTFTHEEIITMYAQAVLFGANCFEYQDVLKARLGVEYAGATILCAVTMATLLVLPFLYEIEPTEFARSQMRLLAGFSRTAQKGEQVGFWDGALTQALISDGPSIIYQTAR